MPLLRSISTSSVNLRYVNLTSQAALQPGPPLMIAPRRSGTGGSAQLALGLAPVGDWITRDAVAFQKDVVSPFSNLIFRPRPRRSDRSRASGRASGRPRCLSSRGGPSRPGRLVSNGLSTLLPCHSVNLLAFDTMAAVALSRLLRRSEVPQAAKVSFIVPSCPGAFRGTVLCTLYRTIAPPDIRQNEFRGPPVGGRHLEGGATPLTHQPLRAVSGHSKAKSTVRALNKE